MKVKAENVVLGETFLRTKKGITTDSDYPDSNAPLSVWMVNTNTIQVMTE